MKILAIETSCDDTGIAVLEYTAKTPPKILADFVSSQTKIHARWGGVVPMLAKREHQFNLVPLLYKTLKQANLLMNYDLRIMNHEKNLKSKFLNLKSILEREPKLLEKIIPFLKQNQKPAIDCIAVTIGPGLEPALWTGVNLARALAYFWKLPIIPINHLEGHILANFINQTHPAINDKLFPAVCLVVSGGHTQLILITTSKTRVSRNSKKKPAPKKQGWRGWPALQYQIIGETRDDAAGEAFDKVAKMLNLGYPGGPAIAAESAKFKTKNLNLKIKALPRPMLNSDNFDFSFSGLKTAVLYFLQKMNPSQTKELTPAIAAEFQQAAIDVLVAKTLDAAKKYNAKTIALAGGVAANNLLRETLKASAEKLTTNFLVPPKNYCVDNAAMIALAACFKTKCRLTKKSPWQKLRAQANLRIA